MQVKGAKLLLGQTNKLHEISNINLRVHFGKKFTIGYFLSNNTVPVALVNYIQNISIQSI